MNAHSFFLVRLVLVLAVTCSEAVRAQPALHASDAPLRSDVLNRAGPGPRIRQGPVLRPSLREKPPVTPVVRCAMGLLAGVPHPLNASLDCRLGRRLGGAIGGGAFSHTFEFEEDDLTLDTRGYNLEGRLRWHPFGGVFFLGGTFGYESLTVHVEKQVEVDYVLWSEEITAELDLSIHRFYATPHLGWNWLIAQRLVLGLELGVQLPVAPRAEADTDIDSDGGFTKLGVELMDVMGMDDLGEDALENVGHVPLPFVALRLGWSF